MGTKLANVWRLTVRWAAAVRDLAFPPQCAFCHEDLPAGGPHRGLCTECAARMGPETWCGCGRCGAILPKNWTEAENCPVCQEYRLHFDTVIPLGLYDGPLRDAVLKMKRGSHDALAMAMGHLLAERRAEALGRRQPDAIVPIPAHWLRRLRRGTNSPEIVAECLGRRLGVPVARRRLVRVRHTALQRDLRPAERFKNVRRAFRLRGRDAVRWKGSHVLLVDDILTTGATSSEAARVLKEAGADTVAVAVVARVQGD